MPTRADAPVIVRRDLEISDLVLLLRTAVGVAPFAPAPGELAVGVGREIPESIAGVDVGGWIAWALAGLLVFEWRDRADHLRPLAPARRRAMVEARRVVSALAMMRADGNITRSAAMVDTSRRGLRESLRGDGLYPWPSTAALVLAPVRRVSAGLGARAVCETVAAVLERADRLRDDGEAADVAIDVAIRESRVPAAIARVCRVAWVAALG